MELPHTEKNFVDVLVNKGWSLVRLLHRKQNYLINIEINKYSKKFVALNKTTTSFTLKVFALLGPRQKGTHMVIMVPTVHERNCIYQLQPCNWTGMAHSNYT